MGRTTNQGTIKRRITFLIYVYSFFPNQHNDRIEIDMKQSFYVGDAAGRAEVKSSPKRRKDHSLADRLFATNVGVRFFTPEEHFKVENTYYSIELWY